MKNKLLADLFKTIRKEKAITQEKLCEGLLSQAALSKFESTGEMPDCMLIELLLQRMGKSSDNFSPVVLRREYEYLDWKNTVLRSIANGTANVDDLNSEIAQRHDINKKLQDQFRLFWTGYLKKDILKMEEAVRLTLPWFDHDIYIDKCCGTDELIYILALLRVELNNNPVMNERQERMLLALFEYIDNKYEDIQKERVYGKAALLFALYGPDDMRTMKIGVCNKAIELKRSLGKIGEVEKLLNLICYDLNAGSDDEIKFLNVLSGLRNDFLKEDNALLSVDNIREYYLLDEILLSYRRENSFSVKEASENICTKRTYMDIENGVRRAKSGTYSMLSHRMSIPESIYDADIIPNTNADLILAEKVKDNMNKGKVEQSIRLTMKLEKQLGSSMSFLENKQFVYGIRDFCYLLSETITPLDYLKRVDKLLKMPVRKKGERGFEEYYTRREIILLIYKAIAYNKAGNNDVSLNLIEKLWDHMLDDNVNLIYRKDEVLLILYQWGKLLYEENDYSGALEKARLGIRYCYFIDCAEKISDFMDVVMNIYKNTYSKSKVVDFYYGKGELDEASILRQFYDDTRVKSLNHVLV